MEKPILKIMADYQCFPLWKIWKNEMENIDPDTLPIPVFLRNLIIRWQSKYDKTLNMQDPRNSGFATDTEATEFENDGQTIWKLLQAELGHVYHVKYYSEKDGRLYDPPA